MADKSQTVTVEALEWHTYNGKAYDIGDTYALDEQLVDSVQFQGKAIPVDRVARAKAAAKPAKPAKSTAVEPMSTKSRGARALAKPRKGKK